jgi:hypothetical protein
MYVLVLLSGQSGFVGPEPEHEPFIDSLIDRQLVLLGGPIGDGDTVAGYVLRCDSLDDARAVVATDPLVASGACAATLARWDLAGIDRRLIDPDLVVVDDGP